MKATFVTENTPLGVHTRAYRDGEEIENIRSIDAHERKDGRWDVHIVFFEDRPDLDFVADEVEHTRRDS